LKPDEKNMQILRLLFWETTIKCNLTCAHCRRVEGDEAVESDMSTEQAEGMIGQLADLGEKQNFKPILIFSGGEPLCRGDLFELIELAKSRGIICALASNGTLIDADIAQKIKDAGIMRVSISLDGADSKTHNKLRQQEGSFEQAIEGINKLNEKQVPFQINVTITKYNCHQIEDVYELARSLGAVAVHIFMLVPVGCGQDIAEEDRLSPEEYEQMLLKIAELDARGDIQIKVTCGPHYERVIRQKGLYKERKSAGGHPAGHPGGHDHGTGGGHKPAHAPTKGCLAGLGVIFVGHQGDVFPCGYLPVNCGNVLKSRLEDIWQKSDDLAKMRNPDQLEGKCGICEYRRVCGGCRARAFAATGNYMEEEPFCTYDPPKKSG
jgi:radical SAM protein with 4Fe4S-binding SPASM domain